MNRGFIHTIFIIVIIIITGGATGYVILKNTDIGSKNTDEIDHVIKEGEKEKNVAKDDCGYISNSIFKSIDKHPGGLSANGLPTLIYWKLTFSNKTFTWDYSDIVETRHYLCKPGGVITDTDTNISGRYDPDTEILTWNGVKYKRERVLEMTSPNKIIDLSNKDLKSIPSYVFKQTEAEELNISDNSLTGAIQAEIRHLTKLKILNAKNNLMTGIPAEIGQLQDLEVLDLSDNQITGLPNELGNLKKLRVLNLSGNQYSEQDLEEIRTKLPKAVNVILN